MQMIVGGAYQGKMDYARARFGLKDEDIYECTAEAEPDFSRRCLTHLERYALFALRRGEEPKGNFRPDAVLLFEDIFCGVVPVEPEKRAHREAAGRYARRVAAGAEGVTRIFCGLAQKLK